MRAGPRARREPARAQVIIKYPNWYEHFQGLGYDLDQEARMFDAIYTGTETRDPRSPISSCSSTRATKSIRYFYNIRPDGGNRGGWVDTFGTRYVDRYAEQLWDTLFAKAPEITLFNWHPMAEAAPADAGTRPWAAMHTSFDWDRDRGGGIRMPAGRPRRMQRLGIADKALDQLGNPVGIASYRPPHATGEDFLHNYLGNLGIPIELYPEYPAGARTRPADTEAASDPQIVAKIERSFMRARA